MKQGRGEVLSDDCPSRDFETGTPNGNCWGDGHYQCKECVHYRADFYHLGQDFIDAVYRAQSGIRIRTLKEP